MSADPLLTQSLDEAARRRFEEARRAGRPEPIESFLPPADDQHFLPTLEELVHIDLEFAWMHWRGSADPRPPLVEVYLERFPPLRQDSIVLRLLEQEFHERQRHGDHPSADEYKVRFPALLAGPQEPSLAPCIDRSPNVGSPLLPLPTFGDYDLLEELGRGGMGVVYKAKQRRLERLVALKLIRPDRLGETSTRLRFHREIRSTARLSHPNIVKMYDADEVEGVPFLAMEYIEGTDLMTLVGERGPLAPATAQECIRQAALGLQHIHERGLVHRDIKPSNLMLALPNQGLVEAGNSEPWPDLEQPGLVKILDLGLARFFQMDPNDAGATLTCDAAMLGTPDYMAPEQADDPRATDIRSDLYSLGCTLYFLLAGDVPFAGGSAMQKVDRHRWERAPLVQQCHPEVPAELAAVVARLMDKHPAVRFQTPAELVAALEKKKQPPRWVGKPADARIVSPAAATRGAQPLASLRAKGLERPKNSTPMMRVTAHRDSVECVTFAPDGRRFATGSLDSTVRIWDALTGKQLLLLDRHQGGLLCAAFTPRGRYLVTGGQDRTVRVWDVNDGAEMRRLEGHGGDINSLSVTPDGRSVLSGGSDRTMRLWDLERGKEVQRFGVGPRDWHGSAVLYVAVTPDGRHALSGGRDRSMRLWDLTTGQEVHRFAEHSIAVYCVAVSPEGCYALSAGGTSLRMFDLHSTELVRRFKGHENSVMSIAFSQDGRMIVSGGKDKTVRVWDAESGEQVERYDGHAGRVMSVALAPNGRQVLSGGSDKLACLWQLGG